jgi:NAD(P)-dependent dehydrogenase (short-subunit alcohol dehydrogenase family)
MGAAVVLVGRDPQKTAAVTEAIRAASGNDQVQYLIADLSSQAQVRRLAEDFRRLHNRLDVLVNNAGAVFMQYELSADDIEMTFALNHLSYFLLTHLLLDLLKASQPARIVNVSSEAHRGQRLNFTDLQNQQHYSGMRAYGQSKLANLYFTYGLAATLEDSGVTANALHPGFVATRFGKNNGGVYRLAMSLLHRAAITPEEGARTSIYLATAPELEKVTGKYFVKNMAVPSSHVSMDMHSARRLWDCSLELTGLPAKST